MNVIIFTIIIFSKHFIFINNQTRKEKMHMASRGKELSDVLHTFEIEDCLFPSDIEFYYVKDLFPYSAYYNFMFFHVINLQCIYRFRCLLYKVFKNCWGSFSWVMRYQNTACTTENHDYTVWLYFYFQENIQRQPSLMSLNWKPHFFVGGGWFRCFKEHHEIDMGIFNYTYLNIFYLNMYHYLRQ